jgi:hypothetical protein
MLSFAMPVVMAFKVLLTLAFYLFVFAARRLREEFHGDERLDWLFIPGFFGFALQYGFVPFLIASPLGLLSILRASRFAERPTNAGAAAMVAAGTLLFFSHGLVFLFSVGAAFGMVVLGDKRNRTARTLLPYLLLGLLCVAYYASKRLGDPLIMHGTARVDWEWPEPWGWHRLFAFPMYVMASTPHDPLFFPAVLFMMAAPLLLGLRPNGDRAALVPLAGVAVAWVLVPGEAMFTTYLYHRFALFLLPAVVWATGAPAAVSRAASQRTSRAVQAGLALSCWAFLVAFGVRERRFVEESRRFEAVLAAAEPGERAVSLIFDPASEATKHPWAYHGYALWYQAERQGFVDFNFAYYMPEPVRFRPGKATRPYGTGLELFQGRTLEASLYRYYFVRHTAPLPSGLFDGHPCSVSLVREAGDWALFERRSCP